MKATGLMGEALITLDDSMVKELDSAAIANMIDDSAAAQESTAKDFADPAASKKVESANA